MSGATGTVRGRLIRLTALRKARNCREYACAVVTTYSKRQRATFTWRVVVFGRPLEVALRTPIGSQVVARGEIYATASPDPRQSMSMACRDFIPQEPLPEPPARRTRSDPPDGALTPRERAEQVFRRQLEMEL